MFDIFNAFAGEELSVSDDLQPLRAHEMGSGEGKTQKSLLKKLKRIWLKIGKNTAASVTFPACNIMTGSRERGSEEKLAIVLNNQVNKRDLMARSYFIMIV